MFAPAFAPFYFSEGLVNSKLALAMISNAWDVTVISMPADKGLRYQSGWAGRWLALRALRHDVEAVAVGSRATRLLGLGYDVIMAGHCVQGVHWSRMAFRKAMEMHRTRPFDVVLSRSTSCCSHLPAMLFKRETSVRWIANWNDPPLHLFPAPYDYAISGFRRLVVRRYLRAAAAAADFNSFPSRHLFEHLRSELKIVDESRVRILPHIGLDGYTARAWKKGDSFKLCHAGNLASERSPGTFLRACRKIIDRYNGSVKVTCDIVGVEDTNLAAVIQDVGLQEHVRFSGPKSFDDTLEAISQCDVAVLIEAPCEHGIFLPSKIIDYAQTGRPILSISPRTGVMRDLLSEYGGGIHADNRSQGSIESALDQFVQLWLENRLGSMNPVAWVHHASPEAILHALESMITEAPAK